MTGRVFRVIGRGRAGGSLAVALGSVGWTEMPALGRGDELSDAGADVDLLVIATPDGEIAAVASQLDPSDGTVVIHLAGSKGLDELAGHPRVGALHPLMTLPDVEVGSRRLVGEDGPVWFAVAGDPVVVDIVEQLDGHAVSLDDADRAIYHAAAAVASNHLVALLGQVERLSGLAGVPFAAYLDLAQASLDNVRELGAADALTGPAARGDSATIAAHLDALPLEERELYLAVARAAARLAGREL